MTRIIAIVVVIVAAVVAYMYTSAGDVEVGEAPTSTQPAGDGATAAETDLPAEEPPEGEAEAAIEEPVANEAAEEALEGELIDGTEDPTTLDAAEEAVTPDDTAETAPSEEGPAGEEPDAGVGAVSTEEETDGAGAAGIVAEEGEQQGLPGEVSEEGAGDDEAAAGTTLESSPSSTTATGEQALETPTGLETTNDGAPDAVIPGEGSEAEAAAAEAATDAEAATTDVGAAIDPGAATAGAVATDPSAATGAAVDPGPALRVDATPGTTAGIADLDALLDPATLDATEVIEAINAANIEPAQRTQLIEALETAQDSPDLLPGVLDRIRAALAGE